MGGGGTIRLHPSNFFVKPALEILILVENRLYLERGLLRPEP
jgi:hypothetical protein